MAMCKTDAKMALLQHQKLEADTQGLPFETVGQQPDAAGPSTWGAVADCLDLNTLMDLGQSKTGPRCSSGSLNDRWLMRN
jgi:hypothetical protein